MCDSVSVGEDSCAPTGRVPAGVRAAPGLVNLVGDCTDHHNGFVLMIGLPQTTRMADERVLRALGGSGRAGHASLVDMRDLTVEHIPFDPAADGLDLLVIDTHVAGRVRPRHVADENTRVLDAAELLRAKRIREIAPLLNASHKSMRDDVGMLVGEPDVAAEAALAGGALGARMTDGCVVALVDTTRTAVCVSAVHTAFATRGFSPPTCWTA